MFKKCLLLIITIILFEPRLLCHGAGLMQNYTSDLLRLAKSAEIRTFMNREKKPCQNFYKFACGNWQNVKTAPIGGKNSYLDRLEELYWQKCAQMLNYSSTFPITQEPRNPNRIDENNGASSRSFVSSSLPSSLLDPPLDVKLKDFYSSCRSPNTSKAMAGNIFSGILRQNGIHGGWPKDIDQDWYEHEYDWLRTIAELRRNLGVNILINLNIVKDVRNKNSPSSSSSAMQTLSYIRLSAPKFDLPAETYLNIDDKNIHERNLYVNHIKQKLWEYFPEMSETWYTEIAIQVIGIEQQLNTARTMLPIVTTAAKTVNRNLRFRYPQELKTAYGNYVDINRYLSMVFNQTLYQPIEEATPGYFPTLVDTIRNTTKMTLLNYTMWKIIQYLDVNAPPPSLASSVTTTPMNSMNSMMMMMDVSKSNNDNQSMNPLLLDNWCLVKVMYYFPAAMENMFGRTYQSMEMVNHLQSIWSDIKRTFRNELLISDRLSWITLETRQKATEKLDAMSLDIPNLNMMSVYRGQNGLEGLMLRHDNYYHNLVQILSWRNRQILEKFLNEGNNQNNNNNNQNPDDNQHDFYDQDLVQTEEETEGAEDGQRMSENGMYLSTNDNSNLWKLNNMNKLDSDNSLMLKLNRRMRKATRNGFLPFYNHQTNRIRVPIKFLQIHVLWDANYPYAILYSTLGFLLAREMLKGFDTQGRRYDKHGYQLPWWDTASEYGYNNRANCFLQQYSKYEFPGWMKTDHPSPRAVDELVADNGALNIAYKAYQQWWTNVADSRMASGEQLPFQRDLNQQQLFFLSFAQLWCADYNSQMDHFQELPERWRVIGALANLNSFAQDYKCPIGNKMNPERKCYLY